MKNKLLLTILVSIFVFSFYGCTSRLSMPKSTVKPASYNPPQPETWVLPNGIKVIFLANNELPVITGALYTRTGTLGLTRSDLVGAGALGGLMRTGGAGDLSAKELDQKLNQLSASIAGSIGSEYGAFSFTGLVSDAPVIFDLFTKVLTQPRFEQDRLKLWQGQALTGIKRRIDDPNTVAGISFGQLLYPDQLPSYVIKSSDVTSLTRQNLMELHKKIVIPDSALFVVSGDLTKENLNNLAMKFLGKWQSPNKKIKLNTDIQAKPTPGIYIIEQDLEQSTIIIGQIGEKRLGENHYIIPVFNEVLSGGFSSRLMQKVRVEQGLAYSVGGGMVTEAYPGKNYITLQTKAENTAKAIQASLSVVSDLRKKLVESEELETTKKSIENSFVFKFASYSLLANRYALLELLEFPKNYDQEYLGKIYNVKADDLKIMASKFLDPSQLVLVVVGNANARKVIEKAKDSGELGELGVLPIRQVKFKEELTY